MKAKQSVADTVKPADCMQMNRMLMYGGLGLIGPL